MMRLYRLNDTREVSNKRESPGVCFVFTLNY